MRRTQTPIPRLFGRDCGAPRLGTDQTAGVNLVSHPRLGSTLTLNKTWILEVLSMTVSEYQAGVIRGAGALLAHTLSAMPEERLDWHPSVDAQSKSRSA